MNRVTIALRNAGDLSRAWDIMCRAQETGGCVAVIREEARSDRQNRLMWPLIKDMQEQVDGLDAFTPDQVKLRFLNALDNEMQFLPELYGGGQFVVGQRSSTLTKPMFANLIELMFKYGAEKDVQWSYRSWDALKETGVADRDSDATQARRREAGSGPQGLAARPSPKGDPHDS